MTPDVTLFSERLLLHGFGNDDDDDLLISGQRILTKGRIARRAVIED